MRAYEILTEGGNAFKDVGAIHISEIKPTLEWLAKAINMPEIKTQTLGTVGKKEYSGDIDVVVDLNSEQMKQLSDTLRNLLGNQNVQGVAGNVITRVPIQGFDKSKDKRQPRTGYVQVDFFPGEPEWMTLYYHAPGDESKLKGVHRNIYLSTIAEFVDRKASKDTDGFGRPVQVTRWRWSPKDGLVKIMARSKQNNQGNWAKKQDVEFLSEPVKNRDLILDIMFKGKAGPEALNSVESLVDATKAAFDKKTATEIFKSYADKVERQGYAEGFEFPPEINRYFGDQV